MRLGTRNVDDWPFDALMVVLAISVALTLAGAAVLFRLLPRVFAGSYEPGQTLWEVLAVPSIRRAAVWAAAAFFVASMVMTATDVHLLALMFRSTSGVDDVALQLQTMHIFSGIGVLLWGIAADFLSWAQIVPPRCDPAPARRQEPFGRSTACKHRPSALWRSDSCVAASYACPGC